MFMALLALLSGLFLSATAAYYSIIGLVAIFPGAKIPIIVMGAALEVTKLVAASWTYRNWSIAPKTLRTYLTTAVVVLIFITSMGIFGFLSRAHLEHSLTAGVDVRAEIATLDTRIAAENRAIDLVDRQIGSLDDSIDRFIELGFVTRGLEQMRAFENDRKLLEEQRATIQSNIIELSSRRNELNVQVMAVEVEVGPLRYIAELIYGEQDAANNFDKTVRWVIILLVSVFDPLAVCMLLAANFSLMQRQKLKVEERQKERVKGMAIYNAIVEQQMQDKQKLDESGEIVYTANNEPVEPLIIDTTVEPVSGETKSSEDDPLDDWKKHREDWYTR